MERENNLKTSVELNTNILGILDVDLYSRNELLNEFDFDNYDNLDTILESLSIPLIENLIKETLLSAEISFIKVYHPKYYNYDSDCIDFELKFNKQEFESLKEKTLKDNKFESFLKDNYSSCSGFISTMADNLDSFLNQAEWKSICQILMYNIDKKDIENANNEFNDLFYSELMCNFDMVETDM